MSEEKTESSWTDFIDQEKFEASGIALLYRNPFKTGTPDPATAIKSIEYQYSTTQGENYLFEQRPVAMGFTAYIGHDEVKSGDRSLKSNIEAGRGFYTRDYYRNYTKINRKAYDQVNDKLPRPKTGTDLEFSFYSVHLENEVKAFKASKRFFVECKNEEDRKLKNRLKEYSLAFLEVIENKLFELTSQPDPSAPMNGQDETSKNKPAPPGFVKELFKSEFPELLKTSDHQTPIKGIRALARFLGIGINKAQDLKNDNALPYFQHGRIVLFDPELVKKAYSNHKQEKNRKKKRS